MLSIGRFAKLANVSPRTVRYYESIGLIKSASRGDNNYRYYDNHWVDTVMKIRDLQALGFSLEEIKDIFKVSQNSFVHSLLRKLKEVEGDIETLRERRDKLKTLLSVSQKIDSGESINDTEREQYMEAIKEEIITGLINKHGTISEAQLRYLERDRIYGNPEKQEFLEAIKQCVEFAKQKNLKLGPGRGSSPASIVLYALGFNSFDPTKHEFYPERLLTQSLDIHIDVEFEQGQEFVDFCRHISKNLKSGQINAFKMPLIDIVKNVHDRLGYEINYDAIDNDSDVVLAPFRSGDLEKIFQFDLSEDALIMKYEGTLSEYQGLQKITEYVKSQPITSFRDVINITALWRPHCQQMIDRIERYRSVKDKNFTYDFLTPELQNSLKENFGLIIYHEDIIRLIATYTNWEHERCNLLRRNLFTNTRLKNTDFEDFNEFKRIAPMEVVRLFEEENPYAFCQPHAVAFAGFTKQTAVLKSLHKDIYYEEIAKWEQKHGFRWDDIGVKLKGVSLLQN